MTIPMIFGINLGFSKSKGSKKSTVNDAQSSTQATNSAQTQSRQTSATSDTNASSTGTQTGTSTQAGSTSQSGSQKSTQTGQQFSDASLGTLNDALARLGDSSAGADAAGQEFLSRALAALNGFDPNQFVQGIVGEAQNNINNDLEANNNALASALGGSAETNTIANLTANKNRTTAEATLGGIAGRAANDATDIFAKLLTEGRDSAAAIGSPALAQLAAALKGGTSSTTGDTQSRQTGVTNNTASTDAKSTNQSQQSTQQLSSDELRSLLTALVNSNSNRTTTEDTKTKGSGFNAGGSFGSNS